jgi:hypothetical protein
MSSSDAFFPSEQRLDAVCAKKRFNMSALHQKEGGSADAEPPKRFIWSHKRANFGHIEPIK